MAMSEIHRPNRSVQRMARRLSPARQSRATGVAPRAVGALATGALALGGLALGAIAVGALALGALGIGRLAVGRARFRHLEIDELSVRRLLVTEELRAPQSIAKAPRTQRVSARTSPLGSESP